MKTILFLCGHNAGRSQMAQALFNHLNTNENFVAESAGTNIANEVNATCVTALAEIGVDMSDTQIYYPKVVDTHKEYHRVYSMGCGVSCSMRADEDLGIDDPAGKSLEEVRVIRDAVREKVQLIIKQLGE